MMFTASHESYDSLMNTNTSSMNDGQHTTHVMSTMLFFSPESVSPRKQSSESQNRGIKAIIIEENVPLARDMEIASSSLRVHESCRLKQKVQSIHSLIANDTALTIPSLSCIFSGCIGSKMFSYFDDGSGGLGSIFRSSRN